MKEKWYPLDNAAQIFPLVSKKRDTNSFRFSAVLKEDVDPILLKQALKELNSLRIYFYFVPGIMFFVPYNMRKYKILTSTQLC